ncbi:UNVERIFIED_CONTAM: Peroxidase 24 [Sesamum indicum]
MKGSFKTLLFLSVLCVVAIGICNAGELKMKYYHKKCPLAETIVREITWNRVEANPSLAAKLLRLHYHDCFVRGCDASVLLDSTQNNTAEKSAPPNRSLSGYDIIDDIKTQLEEECPGVVSCADIVALAARDAVSYQFGRPMWQVFTGREDGKVSLASEAAAKLPSAFADFTTLLKIFADNGLDISDLVALSGAHTIGVSRCLLVARRLYNFTGKGDSDPSLNVEYANKLRAICPNPINSSTIIEMDPQSSLSFDSHYFVALNQKKGLFVSDAALLTDPQAALIARNFENPHVFFARFARSMVKMGAVGVLTNGKGEIRKNCRVVNG